MASRTVAQLTAVISANNTKFKKGISSSKKQLSGFQKSVRAIGPMIAGAFAASAIANFAKEASKAAAEAEGIKRAFANLNQRGLLDELRESVKGTVSDVRLMQAAVKANNFKIPLEQLGMFFQFAQKRAVETGESVDYLVESITNGIARKSLPILDNLGLSATEVRDEFNKTGDMASAVANIIARDMGDTADATLTTAEMFDQARANADNLKVQVGEIINLGINKLLPTLQKTVEFLREAFMTTKMIKRQQLEANILYEIEQDAAEVALVAAKYKELGVELTKGQTYEQKAANALLRQYKQLLVSTNADEQDKIEKYTAQITELEYLAGIKPRPGAVIDPETTQKVTKNVDMIIRKVQDIEDIMNDDYGIGNAFADEFADLDRETEKFTERFIKNFVKVENKAIDMSDTLASSFQQIGSSFAQSLGEVAAGAKSLEEALKEITALIMQSLGDILILTGLSTEPIGIPLILAGLALKGFGSFISSRAGKSMSSSGQMPSAWKSGLTTQNMQQRGYSAVLYGNDIRNSSNYYTDLYNRVG